MDMFNNQEKKMSYFHIQEFIRRYSKPASKHASLSLYLVECISSPRSNWLWAFEDISKDWNDSNSNRQFLGNHVESVYLQKCATIFGIQQYPCVCHDNLRQKTFRGPGFSALAEWRERAPDTVFDVIFKRSVQLHVFQI